MLVRHPPKTKILARSQPTPRREPRADVAGALLPGKKFESLSAGSTCSATEREWIVNFVLFGWLETEFEGIRAWPTARRGGRCGDGDMIMF